MMGIQNKTSMRAPPCLVSLQNSRGSRKEVGSRESEVESRESGGSIGGGLFLCGSLVVVVDYAVHVIHGFTIWRDTFVFVHGAGSGVVGCDGLRDLVLVVLILFEELREVFGTGLGILRRVVRIRVQ